MGQVKGWVLTLDAFFAVITGYSLIDVAGLFIAFSIDELFNIQTIGSIVVTITASVYWMFRISEWLVNKKHRAEYNEIIKQNAELEKQINEQKLKKEMNDNKLKEFQLRQYIK